MTIIKHFESTEALLAFRDHVKTVMAERMSLNLKPRKLDELTAALAGAVDFNTAMGLCKQQSLAVSATKSADLSVAALKDSASVIAAVITCKSSLSTLSLYRTFDAVDFFNASVDNHTLHQLIWTIHEKNGMAVQNAPEYCREENVYLDRMLTESEQEGNSTACIIAAENVHEWLFSRGFTILASWMDALALRTDINPVKSFKQYIWEFDHCLHHQHDEGEVDYQDDVSSFCYAMGLGFKLYQEAGGRWGWIFNDITSLEYCSTQSDAIVDFLDSVCPMS